MKSKKLFSKLNMVHLLILCNLLLAFAAFLKDAAFASLFGTSEVADSINLAFFIPDTIGNNLIGSAIAVSCIPVFARLSSEKEYDLLLAVWKRIIIFITLWSSVITLVLVIYAPNFFVGSDISSYLWIMSPIVVIAPIWLIGSSLLQADKNFIVPAVTPIVFNLVLLLFLLAANFLSIPKESGAKNFALFVTGAFLLVLILTWVYVMKNLSGKIKGSIVHGKIVEEKQIWRVFRAYITILFFSQISLFAERYWASSLEAGTVSALSYAYRFSQFPLWVFIAAITTFILPAISVHISKQDKIALKKELAKSLSSVIFISFFISGIFVFFSEELLTLFLKRGSFSDASVKLTAQILSSYGLSIVGQSLFVFCTRYYVAEGQMKPPVIIGFLGCVMNICLLLVLVPRLGAEGIGYAAAGASTISGVMLLVNYILRILQLTERGGNLA